MANGVGRISLLKVGGGTAEEDVQVVMAAPVREEEGHGSPGRKEEGTQV